MNKVEYLARIRQLLDSLPQEDQERSLAFYAESIEDRIEDGMSEEEAVAALESPEEAANSILMNMSIPKLVKARVKGRRKMGAFEIVLLVLGSPLWFPLLLTAALLMLAFYIVVWSLVLSIGAVVLSLGIASVGTLVYGFVSLAKTGLPGLLLAVGAALVLAGLTIVFCYVLIGAGSLAVALGKAMVRWVKSLLIRKEEKA